MIARFTFLTGSLRGRRVILKHPTISVGGDQADILHLPGVPRARVALIEQVEGRFRITSSDPLVPTTLNGAPVRQAPLTDGDLIRLGDHTIRFGTVLERHEPAKSVRHIARQSWRAAAHLDAGPCRRALFFLGDLCRCTASDASRATRLGWAAMLVLTAVAFGLAGTSLIQTHAAGRRVVALGEQVAAATASRSDLEGQIARLRQMQEATQVEPKNNDERLQRAIDAARGSVAFLLVGYALYEKASRSATL